MKPYSVVRSASLYLGDCREVLAALPACSVDSVVCDPPYDLTAGKNGGTGAASVNLDSPHGRARIGTGNGGGFMGLDWDATGVAFDPETWRQVLRVLRPGGHLLAFGGTRTYHRMACAIEDAGFEIRDQLQWLYGSGFPKSMDVSKAIDKTLGAKQEQVPPRSVIGHQRALGNRRPYMDDAGHTTDCDTPATAAAREWEGWGTALKPANEPICMARKPLIGTVAANVLEHGTGALNIDACRIGDGGQVAWAQPRGMGFGGGTDNGLCALVRVDYGRWPANVILDEETARLLDEQSGTLQPGGQVRGTETSAPTLTVYGDFTKRSTVTHRDGGGASRFFYSAKASKSERSAGGQVDNTHATVKPLDLITYLIRLVTRPGGVVLDPFTGSGTTAVACLEGGWEFVGCELLEHHARIATGRMEAVPPSLFDALASPEAA